MNLDTDMDTGMVKETGMATSTTSETTLDMAMNRGHGIITSRLRVGGFFENMTKRDVGGLSWTWRHA